LIMLDDTMRQMAEAGQTETIGQVMDGPVSPPVAPTGTDPLVEAPALPVREHTQGSERWYAVRHQPHEAPIARQKIRKLGFQTHWPRYILRRPRRDDTIAPLFPGYLFVRIDLARRSWGPIQAIEEVTGLLGAIQGRAPVPAPFGEVERLIQRAGGCDRVIDDTLDNVEPIAPGDAVLVVDGVLAGHGGILRSDRGEARVALLMTMMGVQREVIVPRKAVRKVGAA